MSSRYILNPQDRALLDILRSYSEPAAKIFLDQFGEVRFQDELADWRERLELTVDFNEDPPIRVARHLLH